MNDDLISRECLPFAGLSDVTTGEPIGPVTQGEVLGDEFLLSPGLSAHPLAREPGVPPDRVTEIVNGRRTISASTAVLPGDRFGISAEF